MEVKQFLEMADSYVRIQHVLELYLEIELGAEYPFEEFADATDDLENRLIFDMQWELLDGIGNVAQALSRAGQDTEILRRFSDVLTSEKPFDKVARLWRRLQWQLQAFCNAPSTSARDWRLDAALFEILAISEIRRSPYRRKFHPFCIFERKVSPILPAWEPTQYEHYRSLVIDSDGYNETVVTVSHRNAQANMDDDRWFALDIAAPLGEIIQREVIHVDIQDRTRALPGPSHCFFSAVLNLAPNWPIPFGKPRRYQLEDKSQAHTVYEFYSVRIAAAALILILFDNPGTRTALQNAPVQPSLASEDWSIVFDSWAHIARVLNMQEAKPKRKLKRIFRTVDTSPEGKRTLRVLLDDAFLTPEQKNKLRTL